jgi:hypothetical protein
MPPFDVLVPNVSDLELGVLLAELHNRGYQPVATPVATLTPAVADLPAEWKLVRELDGQVYSWPDKKESYRRYRVFAATVQEGTVHIALGEATRSAWGRDRTYVIAFLTAGAPQAPLVEFLEIIRGSGGDRSKKMYGPGDPLPEEYQRSFRTQLFTDRIDFSGAWNKTAVVARDDDSTTILNHALLQARRRGDV